MCRTWRCTCESCWANFEWSIWVGPTILCVCIHFKFCSFKEAHECHVNECLVDLRLVPRRFTLNIFTDSDCGWLWCHRTDCHMKRMSCPVMPGIARLHLSASLITAALAIVAYWTHDWHSNATDISDACQKQNGGKLEHQIAWLITCLRQFLSFGTSKQFATSCCQRLSKSKTVTSWGTK